MTTGVMTKTTAANALQSNRNPVPADQQAIAVDILNALILDIMDVSLAVRHTQWNIKDGSAMPSVLFDEAMQALEQQADLLAQRVAALGGFAPATAKSIAQDSSIEVFPTRPLSGQEFADAIILRFSQLARSAREALQKADNINEPVTSFYLTEAAVTIEKQLWLFERKIASA